MLKRISVFLLALVALFSCTTPEPKEKSLEQIINESLDLATKQSLLMAESLKDQPDRLPQTIDKEGN